MRAALIIAAVLAGVFGLAFLLLTVGDAVPAASPSPDRVPARAPKPAKKLPAARDPPLPPPPAAPAKRPMSEWTKPRFLVPGREDLELRDWTEVAEAFRELAVMQRELIERPEPTPVVPPSPENPMPERMSKMMRAVERFRSASLDLPEGKTAQGPPIGPSHPAFGANLIAALLDLEKKPLTEAQAERIAALVRARSELVDAADPAQLPDDGSYRLDRIAARAEALDAFYSDTFGVLTPEQGEALVPEKWRRRMRTDVFSSGPSWLGVSIGLSYSEKGELIDRITTGLANQFEVHDRRDELRAIVAAWAEDLPYDPPDVLELNKAVRIARVLRDSRRMAALLRRVVGEMKLSPQAAESARAVTSAYVPLLMAK